MKVSINIQLVHTTAVVTEYQRVNIQCSQETAALIHQSQQLDVAPTVVKGTYEIRAKHMVGVLRYGDLEVRVLPKISVKRLLYLAAFHDDDKAWRQIETLLGTADDPLSAIAHALVFHAEKALRPTPIQGYVTHEQSATHIRGRILFDRQIATKASVAFPAELRFDEYELGIVENKILKAALLVIVRSGINGSLRAHARHLIAQLNEVVPWVQGHAIPTIPINRLNSRYQPALALSRLLLEQRSLEFNDRKNLGSAFLFNMNLVFESYLEASLRTSLQAYGGRVEGQYSTSLDEAGRVGLKPDITWWKNGRCVAVIDAKYKRAKNTSYPNADIYQMFAYCSRLKLRRGYLVYADLEGEEPATCMVRESGIEIIVCSIDISGSIADLRSSIENLAQTVAIAI